jgi:hypothetical protein
MKMNEIMNEGPEDKINVARKLGGAAADVAGAGWDWTWNQMKKMDPRQLYNKDIKTTFSAADKKPGGVLAKHADEVAAANKTTAQNAVQQARIDKADQRIGKIEKVADKFATRGKPTDKAAELVTRQQGIKTDAAGKIVDVPTPKAPDPTSRSVGALALPVAAIDGTTAYLTGSEENPAGYSATGYLARKAGQGIRAVASAPLDVAAGAMDTPAGVDSSAKEKPADTDTSYLKQESLSENLSDILKLAGTKSITQRDNVSGMTKLKEIKQLNESTQIDECGMGMPSNSSTPATISINATASSGEEVANMLKSIMDLAGVKPVTADMLGGPMAPMPMVKAIDIVSAPDHDHDHDHDSMDPQEDELNKTPLTGSMEEEYENTPADPTDVPKYDPEKMVFRPNQPGQGDRMDGTMPKGNPGLGEGLAQSLLKEYEAFKNGQ